MCESTKVSSDGRSPNWLTDVEICFVFYLLHFPILVVLGKLREPKPTESMGINDRDYMREGYVPANRGKKPPKRRPRFSFPTAVLVAIFVVSLRTPADSASEQVQSVEPIKRVVYPLDLNTATPEELMTIPQIGPATAEQIINSRPFEKVEDLLTVYGIGEAKFNVLSQYLTITPPKSELPTDIAPE
jgi:hypothetical protein